MTPRSTEARGVQVIARVLTRHRGPVRSAVARSSATSSAAPGMAGRGCGAQLRDRLVQVGPRVAGRAQARPAQQKPAWLAPVAGKSAGIAVPVIACVVMAVSASVTAARAAVTAASASAALPVRAKRRPCTAASSLSSAARRGPAGYRRPPRPESRRPRPGRQPPGRGEAQLQRGRQLGGGGRAVRSRQPGAVQGVAQAGDGPVGVLSHPGGLVAPQEQAAQAYQDPGRRGSPGASPSRAACHRPMARFRSAGLAPGRSSPAARSACRIRRAGSCPPGADGSAGGAAGPAASAR